MQQSVQCNQMQQLSRSDNRHLDLGGNGGLYGLCISMHFLLPMEKTKEKGGRAMLSQYCQKKTQSERHYENAIDMICTGGVMFS